MQVRVNDVCIQYEPRARRNIQRLSGRRAPLWGNCAEVFEVRCEMTDTQDTHTRLRPPPSAVIKTSKPRINSAKAEHASLRNDDMVSCGSQREYRSSQCEWAIPSWDPQETHSKVSLVGAAAPCHGVSEADETTSVKKAHAKNFEDRL